MSLISEAVSGFLLPGDGSESEWSLDPQRYSSQGTSFIDFLAVIMCHFRDIEMPSCSYVHKVRFPSTLCHFNDVTIYNLGVVGMLLG